MRTLGFLSAIMYGIFEEMARRAVDLGRGRNMSIYEEGWLPNTTQQVVANAEI